MTTSDTPSPEIPEFSVVADSVVLGLGALLRTGIKPMACLQQGVVLCDQIVSFLSSGEEAKSGESLGGLQ